MHPSYNLSHFSVGKSLLPTRRGLQHKQRPYRGEHFGAREALVVSYKVDQFWPRDVASALPVYKGRFQLLANRLRCLEACVVLTGIVRYGWRVVLHVLVHSL